MILPPTKPMAAAKGTEAIKPPIATASAYLHLFSSLTGTATGGRYDREIPRRPRLELPGTPLHVVQRGVNRCAIFVDDVDRQHYYDLLCDAAASHDIAVHAYVFMGNHIHLLLTSPQPEALSRVMRNTGQCYVQAFNRRHRRSGTLWQGRFKSCLVDTERYMMTVYRYIELNPVRAAMVERPEQHRWSSVHANLGLLKDQLVTPHSIYLALDHDASIRVEARRTMLGCKLGSTVTICSESAPTSSRSEPWATPNFSAWFRRPWAVQ
jgi:putative transposase